MENNNSPFLSRKKNDIVVGICSDYSAQGFGVVKIDGFCVFVKGLLLEEKARIKLISLKKTYGYGIIEELLEVSKHRVEEKCTIASICGGCQLQHMSYEAQLQLKQNQMESLFERNAFDVVMNPILAAKEEWRYRNKVQVPFGEDKDGHLTYGFYRSHSNEIIPFEDCLVQSETSNELLMEIQKQLKNISKRRELRHVLIKHMTTTNEVMIVFVVREFFDELNLLVTQLVMQFPQIKSCIANINTRNDNVILGEEEILLYGKKHIKDILCGKEFLLSAKSFYQINHAQTERMYDYVMEVADIQEEDIVLDLYGGIGTMGIIASDKAEKVISVEIVKEAIEDGKKNAEINNVNNIEFFHGDVKDFMQEYSEKVDVVFVDPPRKGIDEETIDSILRISPNRIVYVSCDPQTLVRDLKILTETNYNITSVQPIDLFIGTVHIETVCTIAKRES